MSRQPAWTDAQLRAAVKMATSWNQTAKLLSTTSSGNSGKALIAAAERLGLDTSHFTGQGWNKGTGQGRDKEKQRECAQRWYEANKSVYLDRNKARLAERKKRLAEAKAFPCMDCGVSYPTFVMDFDHRPGEEKKGNIGDMMAGGIPWEKILEEIEKCDLVCANCHRFRTARRLGVYD